MKTFLLLLFFTFPFISSKAQNKTPLTEIGHFGANPGNLKMFVYDGAQKDTMAKPMIVVLHGCGETAEGAARLSGWNKLAQLHHYVMVYPQQRMLNNPDLCFDWFLSHDIEKNQGECASIHQMITYAKQHYHVDSSKIFITGFSAGAAMSVVMMATYPNLFKAGAVFAGGAYKIATNVGQAMKVMGGNTDTPTKLLIQNVKGENPAYKGSYPLMIIYQGLADMIVNPKNDQLIVDQWTGIHHTDSIPDKTEHAFDGVKDISRYTYNDSTGKAVVILYEINNLGHKLLIKPGDKADEGGETGLFGVDLGFHSTYQTAIDFGLIRK